ncbi:sigma factor regulator VreR [Aliidongia dinghuensis]|uniref:Sigma factor regulator VreR n=2 Tax=Aliidongia dinghuensis TaxID=1867774 RepID=A0A8J2YQU5_9PROT|nr:sigma factor regulator VreR [Aliidongia dinghuensis]
MADWAHEGMETDQGTREEAAVKDQAMAWVMRLTSGKATQEDAIALRRWREQSELHRRTFAEAKLLWEALGPAAKEIARRGPVADVAGRYAAQHLGRRAFIGGALAASAGAAAYLGTRPPFGLWPSIDELRADYRTGTGEQRQVVVAGDVSLLLNTRTSVDIGTGSSGKRGIDLISGEAAITANASAADPVTVLAADGRVSASVARFIIRRDEATVRVTSLDGAVEVARHDRSATVPPGHQITYDRSGLGPVSPIDVAAATAWQHGVLIFRHETLAHVIAEVNRYRPGRIVLLDAGLGARDVVASFHLDRIDEVVAHIEQAFGARATVLPGGVVLLG